MTALQARNREERLVEVWLSDLGFVTEYEPEWLGDVGVKKPEFWASGPHDCWIEVKRVTPETASRNLDRFGRFVQSTSKAKTKFGYGTVMIEADTTGQSVDWVVRKLNRAVEADGHCDAEVFAVFDDAAGEEVVVTDGAGLFTIYLKTNKRTAFPAPPWLDASHWRLPVKIVFADDQIAEGKLFEFFGTHENMLCAGQAKLLREGMAFDLNAFSHGNVRVVDRIRRQLKVANGQFRDGASTRRAPGVVVLMPDPRTLVTSEDVAVAAWGDRAVTITPSKDGSPPKASDVFLHRNGTLRGGECAGVSAVLLWHETSRYILLNNKAEFPLSEQSPIVMNCQVCEA